MTSLVWSNGTGLAEYAADHIRLIVLLPGQDPNERKAYYEGKDPTLALGTFLGTVDSTTLPARRWRNAWAHDAGQVIVPILRARLLRLAELVVLRRKRISELSEQIEQAVDNGNTILATALRAKRKSARDVDLTAALQAITDLPTLDTFVPPELQ